MAKKKTVSKKNSNKSAFSRFIRSPKTTVGIFALAAVLLGYGGVGVAQAIPTIRSNLYGAEISMEHIGVTLVENCNNNGAVAVANRDYNNEERNAFGTVHGTLLSPLKNEKVKIIPGKTYNEVLTVRNSGSIDEFVRVTVRKYWKDANGNEIHSKILSPEKIHINYLDGSEWQIDSTATTDERTVLYRLQALAPYEETQVDSGPFVDTFMIDEMLGDVVQTTITPTPENNLKGTIINTEYKYNGYTFVIEAQVDAVQTHNAEPAIRSAWGREVKVNDSNTAIELV